jgi:hypothetical protein
MRDSIIPAPEPATPMKLVGRVVTFDLRRKSGTVTRETGEITAQKWLGLTERGRIPEYEINIIGKSQTVVVARLTEDYVRYVDSKL